MDKIETETEKKMRKCRSCGQMYEVKPGIVNFKNLFLKPTTWDDWIIFVILLLVIVGAFLYYRDVKLCHETLGRLDQICFEYHKAMVTIAEKNANASYWKPMNISIFNQIKIVPNES